MNLENLQAQQGNIVVCKSHDHRGRLLVVVLSTVQVLSWQLAVGASHQILTITQFFVCLVFCCCCCCCFCIICIKKIDAQKTLHVTRRYFAQLHMHVCQGLEQLGVWAKIKDASAVWVQGDQAVTQAHQTFSRSRKQISLVKLRQNLFSFLCALKSQGQLQECVFMTEALAHHHLRIMYLALQLWCYIIHRQQNSGSAFHKCKQDQIIISSVASWKLSFHIKKDQCLCLALYLRNFVCLLGSSLLQARQGWLDKTPPALWSWCASMVTMRRQNSEQVLKHSRKCAHCLWPRVLCFCQYEQIYTFSTRNKNSNRCQYLLSCVSWNKMRQLKQDGTKRKAMLDRKGQPACPQLG